MNVKAAVFAVLPPFARRHAERIDASPIGARFARGAFWSLVGTIVTRVLGIASAVIVARLLGKEGYGELAMVLSTATLFEVFAGFASGLTSTKHVAEFREKDPDKAGRIMGLSTTVAAVTGTLSAVGMYLMAPWLAEYTLAAPHLASLIRIASIMLLLGAMNGAQVGALAGFEAFRAIASINVLAGLLTFPLMVGGVMWLGLEGAVWASVAGLAVRWSLSHLELRKTARRNGIPVRLGGGWQEGGVLWRFSLPAVLSGLLVGPVNWACSALLVNQPNGYGENGLYSAANQWFNAVILLAGILGQAVMPLLSEHIGKGDWWRSSKILSVSMTVNATALVPLVIVGSFASPLIMGLYGQEFAGGWPTLVAVLLTAGLTAVQAPVGQFIAASGRMWTGCLMNMGWAVVFLGATWLWVGWGALGVASARLAAYGVHALWTFGYAYLIIRRGKTFIEPDMDRTEVVREYSQTSP